MGILYIVATPIGNLEDITIRAIRVLLTANAIACEDTRHSGVFLQEIRKRYGYLVKDSVPIEHQPLFSYYEQNEKQRIPQILNGLKNGLHVALISDAGTPTISDPGFKLVREALAEGIRVESVPGPSSVISALVSSGLPTDKFLFLGYPPKKSGHRKTFFENAKKSDDAVNATFILFEAPHKIVGTLEELIEVFGDIEVVIARELTKVHEEIRKQRISELLEHFSKKEPRGEFVLLFHMEK